MAREVTAKSELGEIALGPPEAKLEALDIVSPGYQGIAKEIEPLILLHVNNQSMASFRETHNWCCISRST